LNDSFPKLFCLARNRDATVVDLRSASNNTADWDINFTRLVHDYEVDFVTSFFNVLYSTRVGLEGDDSLCWMLSKRRSFGVKTFCKVLLPNGVSPLP
jgi:hypothetical protein